MAVQIILNGVVAGCLLALVALAFGLVYNGMRIIHIALGACYTATAYFYQIGRGFATASGREAGPVQIFTSIVFALFCAVALAWLIEVAIYRPLYRLHSPPLVVFLSSLGAYLIAINLIGLFFGDETTLLSRFEVVAPLRVGGLVFIRIQLLQLSGSLALIAVFFCLLHKTNLGRNIRALSDNPTLFNIFGYNMRQTRILILALSSLLAGTAALLKAADVGVNPHVGLPVVLSGAVSVMIGAANSFWGVIAGALLLGVAQNAVIYYISAEWSDVATFVLLIVVLTFRREGLFAPALRAEEL